MVYIAADGSRLPTKEAVERSMLRRGVNRAYRDRLMVNTPSLARAMCDDREAVLFDALINKCTGDTVVGVVGAMHLYVAHLHAYPYICCGLVHLICMRYI